MLIDTHRDRDRDRDAQTGMQSCGHPVFVERASAAVQCSDERDGACACYGLLTVYCFLSVWQIVVTMH